MSPHQATALKTPIPAPQTGHEPTTLFSPYRLGDLELGNRLVMAPMTRSRAVDGNVPNSLADPVRTSAPSLPRAATTSGQQQQFLRT